MSVQRVMQPGGAGSTRRSLIKAATLAGLAGVMSTGMKPARSAAEPGSPCTNVVISSTQSGVSPSQRPLARAIRALGAQAYAPAKIVLLGSSTTEGWGASHWDRRYTRVLEQKLQDIPGGYYCNAFSAKSAGCPVNWIDGALPAFQDPGWSTGWAGKSVVLPSKYSGGTFTFTGTSAMLVYGRWGDGPVLDITIDGKSMGRVNSGGPLARWAEWRSPILGYGRHTMVVRSLGGARGFLRGYRAFNYDENSGVHLYEGGSAGSTSLSYLDQAPQWQPGTDSLKPDLVVLQLGANDYTSGADPAAMATNLKRIVELARAGQTSDPASVIVMVTPQTGSADSSAWNGAWLPAWRKAAVEVGGFLLDAGSVLPRPGQPGSLFGPDGVHFNDQGHAVLAHLLVNALRSP